LYVAKRGRETLKEVGVNKAILGLALASVVAGPAASQEDDDFADAVLSARVIELNFVWSKTSPVLPLNPPFTMGLQTSHEETAGIVPGIAFAEDMMFFSGQHGAPTIDALGHISKDGKLFGGIDAAASEGASGLTALGIENYPKDKFVNRGVLLDVARQKGVEALEPGYVITAADLEAAVQAEDVEIRPGDSVLVNTGHGRYFDSDPEKYKGPIPGLGEESARWLAAKHVFLVGADQLTVDAGFPFPAHRTLIAENGIYIVENVNLGELATALAERGKYDFVLVLNPLRLKGATASPLNAFALLP